MTHLLVGGSIPQAPFEQLRVGAGCAFGAKRFFPNGANTWSDSRVLRGPHEAIPRWLSDVKTFIRNRARKEDDFMFPT